MIDPEAQDSDNEDLRPVLTQDGSFTLHSCAYAQTYHSKSGAATECRQVFLINSGTEQRLRLGQPTRVLEIGFGCGLNFLLTADCCLQHNTSLQYAAIEKQRVSVHDMNKLGYEHLVTTNGLSTSFLSAWNMAELSEKPVLQWNFGTCDLVVHFKDAIGSITDFADRSFDVIYLDAFSPEANSELWTETFLSVLFECLKKGGTLVTYCVNRTLQDRLSTIGFDVVKARGPEGGKREVMIAHRRG